MSKDNKESSSPDGSNIIDGTKNDVSPESTVAPEMTSNLLSRLLFAWAKPLFRRASSLHKEGKVLDLDDLIPLPSIDYGKTIAPQFEKRWEELEDKATIASAVRAVVGKRFIMAGFIKVINTSLQFCFPILLNEILKFIQRTQAETEPTDEPWNEKYKGYWLSAILFCTMGSKAITENLYFHAVYRAAYQVRVAISVAVYNKALRLASAERHGTTLGELINLMQVDATKIEMFIPQVHTLWDGLFQITGYMAVLYTLIGWPCFCGLAVMVLAGPIQGIIMQKLLGLNRAMVTYTDDRVKRTNEAIQGIRSVKMYTWEEQFLQVIAKSRQGELDFLAKVAYLRGFSRAYMGALPSIVAVVSYAFYATLYAKEDIAASTLFSALIAFDQLRFPLMFYPMALAQYVQAKVSTHRVEAFLKLREVNKSDVQSDLATNGSFNRHDESILKGQIVVNDIDIYWEEPDNTETSTEDSMNAQSVHGESSHADSLSDVKVEEPEITHRAILKGVSLNIKPGELMAVVGRVGSGKSTLCSSILNETLIRRGSVGINGTMAYAAQTPWILNATLRDNIIFGLPFDEERYNQVITACQLIHDLDLLDYGDLTEIGENGINLSGGQKQRVSVARAAYSGADIIILDDPLSALDPEVGKKLFDECILKLMKGKTRIVVTNQLQCLRFCDTVVALGKGRIIEQGSYDHLHKNEGEVQRLLADLKESHPSSAPENDEMRSRSDSNVSQEGAKRKESIAEEELQKAKKDTKKDKLLTDEERNTGAVTLQVYKKYIMCGGGYFRFGLLYVVFIVCNLITLGTTAWLSFWTSDASYSRNSLGFYLGMYGALAVLLGFFTFIRSFLLAKFCVQASNVLHKNLLRSILNAPMIFFDTTPSGRILSRFSKDLYSIDTELSDYFDFFLTMTLTIVISLGSIVYITPWFGVALIPMVFIYITILNYFREVARETKRLESISRSPVFAHFSETLGGLGTIRAYGQTDRFIDAFEKKMDTNTRAFYNNKCADRWLSVRLELLGSCVAGAAAVASSSVVINNATSGSAGTDNFSSLAGLSLSFAIPITGILNWTVRSFAQMEAAMNASERVMHYTENIAQEAPARTDEMNSLTKLSDEDLYPSKVAIKAKGVEKPSSDWPTYGSITLHNLKMRYRKENPLVIKGLTIDIKGGERIGVVGRTGSGKSSLLLALLRIVEPDIPNDWDSTSYESPISIDGIDVLRIGIRDLRSKIGIIPQNPVLFSGTIRSNMDPFGLYTDEEVWNAIRRCGMKEAIEQMPELLDAPVAEYGENLSQGQRQLLCLGRALLKKCKILLLDEATSSVDYQTDQEIQRTLREDFAGCTVLTIAHRVNTIMDSDKILVMVDGKVGEFASPDELLADKRSSFSSIVKSSQTEHS